MEKKARYDSHLQFWEKCSNNIIPNGFRLKWKMNLDSCKEKQLSVKEILDETSGKLIEESIKVSKAELIKTNTTLETLKHNFDNFEHDSIDTILNIEYKNHEEKLKTKTRKYQNLQRQQNVMYQNNTNSTQTKTTSSCTADTTDINVINVIGDGNFFSWCISVYFNEKQTHHETIRQQVVNKMQSNSNTYKQFVSGSFNKHLGTDHLT